MDQTVQFTASTAPGEKRREREARRRGVALRGRREPGSLGGGGRACASASLLFWAPLASLPELPLCRQLDGSRVVLRVGPCTCRLVDFADRWVLDYSSADRMFLEVDRHQTCRKATKIVGVF